MNCCPNCCECECHKQEGKKVEKTPDFKFEIGDVVCFSNLAHISLGEIINRREVLSGRPDFKLEYEVTAMLGSMWIAERGLKEVKYGNGKESRKLRVFTKDYLGMYPTN